MDCACGCGQQVDAKEYSANGKRYIRKFICGHNFKIHRCHTLTEEHKRKIGEAHKGKPGTMLGRHHREESKEKSRQSNLGQKRSDESRNKMRLAHLGKPAPNKGKKLPQRSGSNHHNWKDGASPERNKIRGSLEYKVWSRAVLEKSHFKCVRCERPASASHHIRNFAKHPDLRFKEDNGAALCRECHEIFHWQFGKSANDEKQFARFLIGGGF